MLGINSIASVSQNSCYLNFNDIAISKDPSFQPSLHHRQYKHQQLKRGIYPQVMIHHTLGQSCFDEAYYHLPFLKMSSLLAQGYVCQWVEQYQGVCVLQVTSPTKSSKRIGNRYRLPRKIREHMQHKRCISKNRSNATWTSYWSSIRVNKIQGGTYSK